MQSVVPSSYMASTTTNSKLLLHSCKIDIKANSSTTSRSAPSPSSETLCTQPATTPVVESSLPLQDNAVSVAEVPTLLTATSTECTQPDHMSQPYNSPQQTSQTSSSPPPVDTTTNSPLLLTPKKADNSPVEEWCEGGSGISLVEEYQEVMEVAATTWSYDDAFRVSGRAGQGMQCGSV